MSKKTYDAKKEATFLANVLKHNKELVNEEGRFDDLVVALEIRMMEAFNAGKDGKVEIEVAYEAPDLGIEILPPVVPVKASN